MTMNNKALILLSGGLDSVVSLSEGLKTFVIEQAITFNYGQKAFEAEFSASKEISQYYNINHSVIELDWFKNLVDFSIDWIPNRNGVFINIAAAIAEKYNIDNIIVGINKEESIDFKDNSQEFLFSVNNSLKNSTQNEVRVIAPLINNSKDEIVKIGLENNIPFDKIYSCYKGDKKHCGECKSCLFLKNALFANNRNDLVSKLF